MHCIENILKCVICKLFIKNTAYYLFYYINLINVECTMLKKIIIFPQFIYYLILNIFNISNTNIKYNANIGQENINCLH